MTGHDDGRRYTVTQRNGSGKTITEVKYPEPQQALTQFKRSLQGAGHGERRVDHYLTVWTLTLMRGAQSYEVLDPGLNGSTSIRITTA